jgi:hypothetical protein
VEDDIELKDQMMARMAQRKLMTQQMAPALPSSPPTEPRLVHHTFRRIAHATQTISSLTPWRS